VEHGSTNNRTESDDSVEHGLTDDRADDVTVTVGVLDDFVRSASADTTAGASRSGFYVEDDGVGIPVERRDRVFDDGYSTQPSGTGFGLSIVREIAEAHDWTVEVVDGSDGGARFEFRGIEGPRQGSNAPEH
jgi:signal transduction histidine kinase